VHHVVHEGILWSASSHLAVPAAIASTALVLNVCSPTPVIIVIMTNAFQEALPFFTPTASDEAATSLPLGNKLPSYIKDHRQRLRYRFLIGGAAALPDYELLELVLFRAIPRKDVKPLARALIDKFGDFNRVIAAPVTGLQKVIGVGDAVVLELKIVEAAAHRMARGRIMARHVVSS